MKDEIITLEQFEEVLRKFNWCYDVTVDNATWRSDDQMYRNIKTFALNMDSRYKRLFNIYYALALRSYYPTAAFPFTDPYAVPSAEVLSIPMDSYIDKPVVQGQDTIQLVSNEETVPMQPVASVRPIDLTPLDEQFKQKKKYKQKRSSIDVDVK